MRVVVVVAGALGAMACRQSIPHPKYSPQDTSALKAVDAPPPPGRVETMPQAPPGAVWIDGEWTRRRSRWAWSPGRWVAPPPGATYCPWAFTRAPDGSLWYAPGTWHDAKGAVIEAPAAISIAQADSVEIVNASGDVESTGATLRSRTSRDAGR